MSRRRPRDRVELARRIDHTLLRPEADAAAVRRLCAEARSYRFRNVCVNPNRVALAAVELAGSGVGVCSVVGFPLGASCSATKAFEARRAVADGATELDTVIDVGALKDGEHVRVVEDLAAVVEAAGDAPVKAILEVGLLTAAEIDRACRLAERAGAAFVKTSTGLLGSGATVESVRRMRAAVGTRLQVKAAGGIRDARTALALLEAGADRLGASVSTAIVGGWEERP